MMGRVEAWREGLEGLVGPREEAVAVIELSAVGEEVSSHAHGGELLHATLLAALVLEPHLRGREKRCGEEELGRRYSMCSGDLLKE